MIARGGKIIANLLAETVGVNRGGRMFPVNRQIVRRIFRTKAKGGDAAAQEHVSRLLEHGQGVPVDLEGSFGWAEKSAQAGFGLGQFRLGLMYRYGTGTEPDENKSNEWFAKAAKSLPAMVKDDKNPAAMRSAWSFASLKVTVRSASSIRKARSGLSATRRSRSSQRVRAS